MNLQDFSFGCIYKCKCPEKYSKETGQWLYHCRNWTFSIIRIITDNTGKEIVSVDLSDTYFNNKTITVTSDNADDFEFVFDTAAVKRIREDEANLYEPEDVIRCRVDSSSKHYYYIKIGTKVSQARLIDILTEQVNSAKRQLENAQEELGQAIQGTHYKLNR